jgi:dipeptide/tripeptide permease
VQEFICHHPALHLQNLTLRQRCLHLQHCHRCFASLSLWLYAIPVAVTACSEVFINVTAYGIAYSRAPPNMKGFVMALSLFMTAISTAISLATANAIQDPYLVWAFAAPSIIGFVAAFVFYWLFRHLDDEEFFVHVDDVVHTSGRWSDEEGFERKGEKI